MTQTEKINPASENEAQADVVRKFMETLNQSERRSLLDFLQGARFGRNLTTVSEGKQS